MHDEPESIKIISKTQLKKEATALQELGRELTDFKANDLDKLELSTRLRAAIDEFKKLPNAHGAKKRHLQYIGRLMRESDGEDLKRKIRHLDTSPQISPKVKFENEIFEQIMTSGDVAINEIVIQQQRFDRQQLRQLKNNIVKAAPEKRGSLENKLRKYIRLNISS